MLRLLEKIEISIENADYQLLDGYYEEFENSKKLHPLDKYVMHIENTLDELAFAAEQFELYESIKSDIISQTSDAILADNIAWDLIYGV